MTRPRAGRTCPTGKRRFRDRTEAMISLTTIRHRSNRDKVPVRWYPCPLCKGYHLTSQDLRGQ